MGTSATKDLREERQIAEECWNGEKDVELLCKNFYKDLLGRDETIRHLFAHCTRASKRQMILTLVDWMLHPPSETNLRKVAVRHAHLGVNKKHIALLKQSFMHAIVKTLLLSDPSVVGAWQTLVTNITATFSEICTACGETLRQAKDEALSHNKNTKKVKAIKTLKSHLTAEDSPTSGYLLMSQYSCLNWKPPVTTADHSLTCFRRRWIELRSQYVYYYRSKNDDKPIGLIDLATCQLIDTDRSYDILPSPAQFSFALQTQVHDYPYYFIADGDNTKEEWFRQLRGACNRFSLIRSDLIQGCRIRVWVPEKGDYVAGTCQWVGQLETESRADQDTDHHHHHRDGLWVGVELSEPVGQHSGTVNGHQYFICKPNYGMLLPANQVVSAGHLEIEVEGESIDNTKYLPSDFDFLDVLGKGSFGRVCKVREKLTGSIYACKILQKAALQKESHIKNVTREKSLLLNIKHPYIVKLHAAFQTRGRLFLLFDFLSGGELFYHLQNGEPCGEDRAKFYIAEISLAVHHLHTHNILHRDLKAENLVLDAEGHVVLTDFGFAKTIEPDVTNTTKCGTLPYMAPEMLRQGPNGYSIEVDWWALGVLLFLMITGCYPFYDKDPMVNVKQILYREITTDFFASIKGLSYSCKNIICALLSKQQSKRLGAAGFFNNEWFTGFDWVGCRNRDLQPPFVPESSGRNTKYFDTVGSCQSGLISTMLPPTWDPQVLSSFYDVHQDYKHVSSDVPEQDAIDEDKQFLNTLNNWSDQFAPPTKQQLTNSQQRYIIDT